MSRRPRPSSTASSSRPRSSRSAVAAIACAMRRRRPGPPATPGRSRRGRNPTARRPNRDDEGFALDRGWRAPPACPRPEPRRRPGDRRRAHAFQALPGDRALAAPTRAAPAPATPLCGGATRSVECCHGRPARDTAGTTEAGDAGPARAQARSSPPGSLELVLPGFACDVGLRRADGTLGGRGGALE